MSHNENQFRRFNPSTPQWRDFDPAFWMGRYAVSMGRAVSGVGRRERCASRIMCKQRSFRPAFPQRKPMRLCILLVATTIAGFAQNDNLFKQCVPHLAAGGGWSTSISIYNMTDTIASGKLQFFDSQARPLSVPVSHEGSLAVTDTVQVTLAANGSTLIDLPDIGTSTAQGYAVLTRAVGGLSASATFRQRVAGRPDFEATVPGRNVVTKNWGMLFDNTNGLSTSVAIVNPDSAPAEFRFLFYDGAGSPLVSDVVRLNGGQHQAFSSAARWGALVNRRGTVHVSRLSPGASSADFGVNVLALRFNPTGAFSWIIAEPTLFVAVIQVIQ